MNKEIIFLYPPAFCPYCHKPTVIKNDVLYCENAECSGKIINQLEHFCGKKGLDIKGLSIATLEKLLDWDWIEEIQDIFTLKNHEKEWINKPGFGPASVRKILAAIETAKNTTLDKFICALGIPLVGPNTAKQLAEYFGTWDKFREHIRNNQSFYEINGFGPELNNALTYFNYDKADNLVSNFVTVNAIENTKTEELQGLNFVITGSLKKYKNRAELQKVIESKNGKVSNSISRNTSYLICNDTTSTSAKHLAASRLGVPIITEDDFVLNFLT